MTDGIKRDFENIFGGSGDIAVYFAPGRVNLIGEHIDYNGGCVLPCALTMGTYLALRTRGDRRMRFFSKNFAEAGIIECDMDHIKRDPALGWVNYPLGVQWAFEQKGYALRQGFDMLLSGNLPRGSGLSSSASVEVAAAVAFRDLCGREDISEVEIAQIGQYAENRFSGVRCGIMDQFVIAVGKRDHAVFLNTADLSYEYEPMRLESQSIVIASSNKKRKLGESKYNERRAECEEALSSLQTKLSIRTLADLCPEEYDEYKSLIRSEVCRKRARHAVCENRRVIEAAQALRDGNLSRFGVLMGESHISLRDDYEVSGMELDTLAECAWAQRGVIGARMTGAGFGGCTVNLVENEYIDEFIANVGESYQRKIGCAADFYTVRAGDGAGRAE